MPPPPRRPALSPEHRRTLTVSITDHSLAAGPRGSVCSPSAFLPVGGAGAQGEQPVGLSRGQSRRGAPPARRPPPRSATPSLSLWMSEAPGPRFINSPAHRNHTTGPVNQNHTFLLNNMTSSSNFIQFK